MLKNTLIEIISLFFILFSSGSLYAGVPKEITELNLKIKYEDTPSGQFSHYNLTNEQIEIVRREIGKVKFPAPAGTARGLFPPGFMLLSSSIGCGGLNPANEPVAVETSRCNLNKDYILELKTGRYIPDVTNPKKGYYREISLKVLPQNPGIQK